MWHNLSGSSTWSLTCIGRSYTVGPALMTTCAKQSPVLNGDLDFSQRFLLYFLSVLSRPNFTKQPCPQKYKQIFSTLGTDNLVTCSKQPCVQSSHFCSIAWETTKTGDRWYELHRHSQASVLLQHSCMEIHRSCSLYPGYQPLPTRRISPTAALMVGMQLICQSTSEKKGFDPQLSIHDTGILLYW